MARRGKIRLGDQEYVARLIQSQSVSGRYDGPSVQLEVYPADRSAKTPPLLESGPLAQMQLIDGQYLTVSASPLGDKLTIAPYKGDFGVLEIGPGGRAITECGAVGQLVGRERMVPLGTTSFAAPEKLPRTYKVPVGQYMLPSFTAQYGRVRFAARMMPGASPPFAGGAAGPAYPVAIRKDKPYVLEFSGKPEVNFMRPTKDQSFKPGDNIYIGAMLNEPWQKIQITGLWDATQKKGVARYRLESGEVTVPQYAQLDPTISIRSSTGAEVAAGKMPFG
jgi:hypothetical protein